MRSLLEFSTMLTYSRGMFISQKVSRSISCALSSHCVQAQRNSSGSGILMKLNLSIPVNAISNRTDFLSAGILADHTCLKYSNIASPSVYNNSSDRNNEVFQTEVDESLAENVDDRNSELERQRFIWNVGPAFRPSSNIASFVNDSALLQTFLKMGVELYRWDKLDPKLLEQILHLDFEKDVAPYVRFLCDNGVPPDELKHFFSKNPKILLEDLTNLNTRIQYLKSKAFSNEQITRIITHDVTWLSRSTGDIDKCLGYFQTTFKLTGNQIRELATKDARTITTKRAQLMEITFKIKDEMGFEPTEIISILLAHPSIWRQRAETIWRRFDYVHNTVKFSHETIAKSAKLLLTREGRLRARIGYLQHVGRAQFDPEKPNFVSIENIVSEEDAHFAVTVAKSSVQHFNDFLKSM